MAAGPDEIELKFLVEPPQLSAVAAMAGRPRARTLITTYFDTPSRALNRAGVTLRTRFDGKVWTHTVKTAPANGKIARGEWEWTAADGGLDLERIRQTPAGSLLGGRSKLREMFTVRVERRDWLVREGGASIECALDVGAVSSGARCEPFRELELELKSGALEDLLALARRTRERIGLTPSFTTKAERGFALVAGGKVAALAFEAPALDPETSVGDAFRAIAHAALRHMAGNAERLRRSASPAVVHQMRVGARRLRSTLSTFSDLLSEAETAPLRRELKWISGELDAARNLDVLLEGAYRRAVRGKADPMGLRELGRRLRMQRAAAYARAHEAAGSERFARLLMDAQVWLEAGPWTQAAAPARPLREAPVADFAAHVLTRRRKRVAREGRDLEALSRVGRHALRIEAKKLRYAADSFTGLWGHPKRSAKFLAALKALQDRLGELNDIATAERLAHDMVKAAAEAGEADWAAGRLIGGEIAREAALLKAAAAAHKAFRKAGPFWSKPPRSVT